MMLVILAVSVLLSKEVMDTNIVIYSNNIAVVKQNYEIICDKGNEYFTIDNLPQTIIPDSLTAFFPKGFDLSFHRYYVKDFYIKKKARLFTEDGRFIDGTIYIDSDPIIVVDDNGNHLSINRKYVRYIDYNKFDEKDLKKSFRNSGYVEFVVSCDKGKKGFLDVIYLMNGMMWRAMYDAYVSEDEKSFDLKVRADITNTTNSDFKNASVILLAGDINTSKDINPPFFRPMAKGLSFESAGIDNKDNMTAETVVDYYYYEIPNKIDINDGQTLSIPIFSRKDVKFDKYYLYKGQRDLWYFYDNIKDYRYNRNLDVFFAFKNDKDNLMDIPLPGGKIRIYRENKGYSILAGETDMKNTPVNSDIELKIGKAFDVEGDRKIVLHKKIAPNIYRDTIEIIIKNEKKQEISVKVKEYLWGNWKIIETSDNYKQIDVNNIEFNIKVQPKSTYILKYTAEYDFNR